MLDAGIVEKGCGSKRCGGSQARVALLALAMRLAVVLATVFVLAVGRALVQRAFAVDPVEQGFIAVEHAANAAQFALASGGDARFAGRSGFVALPAEKQRAYAEVYRAAFLMRGSVTLDGVDGPDAGNLVYTVWYDSPELFFLDPATATHSVTTCAACDHTVTTVRFSYLMDGGEAAAARAEFDAMLAEAADDALGPAGPVQDDEAKVRAVHQWLLDNVSYDCEAGAAISDADLLMTGTAYGALKDGSAICGGYSQLFTALCERAGIECRTLIGKAGDGDGHAWNAVRLAGEWRYVDATWDDSANDPEKYCLVDESFMAATGHAALPDNALLPR